MKNLVMTNALVLGLAGWLAPLAAAGPGTPPAPYTDAGPHAVGWRDEVHPFVNGKTLTHRIYYPSTVDGPAAAADPGSGPYRLVALIHGATGTPDFYDQLSVHVARYGYVVASLGGMDKIDESYANMANETKKLLDWVVLESQTAGSPYAGLVDDGDRGVIAHSRGGVATSLLIGMAPEVRAACMLEPSYVANTSTLGNFKSWDGSWLFVAGSVDTINPPTEVKSALNVSTGSPRRGYVELVGAGHAGPLDPDIPGVGGDPLPHLTQLGLHQQLTIAFLEAELRGEEDAWHQILGVGLGVHAVQRSLCTDPPLWVVEHPAPPTSVTLGLGGMAGDAAYFLLSAGAAAIPTAWGTFLLDPATLVVTPPVILGAAALEIEPAVPAGAAGLTVHVQGLVLNASGALSRADVLIAP